MEVSLRCKSAFNSLAQVKQPCIVRATLDEKYCMVTLIGTTSKFKISKVKVVPNGNDTKIQSDGLALICSSADPQLKELVAALDRYSQQDASKPDKDKKKSRPVVSSGISAPVRPIRDETPKPNKRMAPMTAYSKSSGPVSRHHDSPLRRDSPIISRNDESMVSPIRSPDRPRFAASPAIQRSTLERSLEKVARKALFQSPGAANVTSSSSSASLFPAEPVVKTYGKKQSAASALQPMISLTSEPPIDPRPLDFYTDLESDYPNTEHEETDYLHYSSIVPHSLLPNLHSTSPAKKKPGLGTSSSQKNEQPLLYGDLGIEEKQKRAPKVDMITYLRLSNKVPPPKQAPVSPAADDWRAKLTQDDDSGVSPISPLRPPAPAPSARNAIQSYWAASGFSHGLAKVDSLAMDAQPAPRVLYQGGMRNLGNTCYVSSVLQAMCQLDLMADLLSPALQPQELLDLTADASMAKKQTFTAFIALARQRLAVAGKISERAPLTSISLLSSPMRAEDGVSMLSSSISKGGVLDVLAVQNAVRERCDLFAGNGQQDAHEFWTTFLSQLDEDLMSILNRNVVAGGLAAVGSPQGVMDLPPTAEKIRPRGGLFQDTMDDDEVIDCAEEDGDDGSLSLRDCIAEGARPVATVSQPSSASITSLTPQAKPVVSSSRLTTMEKASLLPTSYHLESVMKMTYACTSCGYRHAPRNETYRDFSLDLPSRPSSTDEDARCEIKELLQQFLASEERELTCPQCEIGERIRIYKHLVSLPPCLVLHLKRFQYDPSLQTFKKIMHRVEFPIELDVEKVLQGSFDQQENVHIKVDFLQTYHSLWAAASAKGSRLAGVAACWDRLEGFHDMINKQAGLSGSNNTARRPVYQLKAVVRHMGTDWDKGHYLCDVRERDGWVRCNDAVVSKIDEEKVLQDQSTPYLLYYQVQT